MAFDGIGRPGPRRHGHRTRCSFSGSLTTLLFLQRWRHNHAKPDSRLIAHKTIILHLTGSLLPLTFGAGCDVSAAALEQGYRRDADPADGDREPEVDDPEAESRRDRVDSFGPVSSEDHRQAALHDPDAAGHDGKRSDHLGHSVSQQHAIPRNSGTDGAERADQAEEVAAPDRGSNGDDADRRRFAERDLPHPGESCLNPGADAAARMAGQAPDAAHRRARKAKDKVPAHQYRARRG